MNTQRRLISYLVDNEVNYAEIGKKLAKQHPEIFMSIVDGGTEVERARFREVIKRLRSGETVSAIKELRNISSGLGLKEAKDVIYSVMIRAIDHSIPLGGNPLDATRREFLLRDRHAIADSIHRAGHEDLAHQLWCFLRD